MHYPIFIEIPTDDKTAFGAIIPDIDGAITAADTIEQLYPAANEVAHIMLEQLSNDNLPIPCPKSVVEHLNNPDLQGMHAGLIDIDIAPYLGKTEKINVTIPAKLIAKIDAYISKHPFKSRSSFLTTAAFEKLNMV